MNSLGFPLANMDGQAPSPASSTSSFTELYHAPPTSSDPQSVKSETPPQSQELPQLPAGNSASGREVERHPKGKRKRTAAKDKSILEASYNANPKPDKAARLDIVSRVSLNEKEVQIWFQNRRQNDRRKSRPLSPQEIAALRCGGLQILSSDPAPFNMSNAMDHHPLPHTSPQQSMSLPPTANVSPVVHDEGRRRVSEGDLPKPGIFGGEGQPDRQVNHTQSEADASSPRTIEGDNSAVMSQSFSSSVGYLSNRWNVNSSFSTPTTLQNREGDDSLRLESYPPSTCSSTASSGPILPPPKSQVRLSLSLDGKAELVSGQLSPRPPQETRPSLDSVTTFPQVRSRVFQRSHSALPSITLPPISALTGNLPPRLARGRSRDVHAWELCCDAEARDDELITQAKNESNGSAIAAISLLRSSSGILQSNSQKRNTPPRKSMSRSQLKKPKLARMSSSMARTQSLSYDKPAIASGLVAEKEDGKMKVSTLLSPAGGDSDKENWSPDEDGNPNQGHRPNRRPLPGAAPERPVGQKPRRTIGRLLEERRPVLTSRRANAAPTMRGRGKRGDETVEVFEDGAGGAPRRSDEDVARFMRGEVSPSKKGDMDCVAGLLSLSQGNWR